MDPGRLSALRSDLAGGVTAAVLTIPLSMGYGALAVHGLGERYIAYGALAGLYGAIVVPVVAVLLGARNATAYAPRSVVASLIGSLVVHSLVRAEAGLVDLDDVRGTLGVLFFVLLLAGVFQALFGALRLGGLVRYIPSPVMAGFQNAAAVLILVSQIGPLLGLRASASLVELPAGIGAGAPVSLAIGLLTAVTMWQGRRMTTRIPAPLLALAVGSGAYSLVAGVGFGHILGPVMGAVPAVVPTGTYLPDAFAFLGRIDQWKTLVAVVAAGFSLAIIASLDALLCAKTADGITGQRTSGNAQLLRLGVGNTVAASLGGMASGVNLTATLAAHRAGARTTATLLANAGCILLAVLLLAPALAHVPRVVIAGMLLVVAFQLADPWTFQVARRMVTHQLVDRRRMALDLCVTVLVATLAIAVNLIVAVATGVGAAVLFFLLRMSKTVVRRAYRGDVVHSRKTRPPRLMEVLQRHGGHIVVFELEGPIFFGTAEDLARRVEAVQGEITHVVLDLKRVNEVDTTGARILLQVYRRLQDEGKDLALSHLTRGTAVANVLEDVGFVRALGVDRIFDDSDRALEWAEDDLIARTLGAAKGDEEYELEHLDLLVDLSPRDREALRPRLTRRTYQRGTVVFREGDEGRELYIIARGAASVRMKLAGENREKRLATFAAGTVFGELALLDAGPRSATVQADDDLVCYVLTADAFAALAREHEGVGIKLLASVGRELGRRLRRANQTIYQLET